MTDETVVETVVEPKTKRSYRKVNETVLEAILKVSPATITLDELVTATGITKWYCKTVAEKLVTKGKVKFEDGKYSGV